MVAVKRKVAFLRHVFLVAFGALIFIVSVFMPRAWTSDGFQALGSDVAHADAPGGCGGGGSGSCSSGGSDGASGCGGCGDAGCDGGCGCGCGGDCGGECGGCSGCSDCGECGGGSSN